MKPMIAGTTVEFPGDPGKYANQQGHQCVGRAFLAKQVGVGAVYINTVECTTCHRELDAWENGLVPSPSRVARNLAEALDSTPLPPVEDIAGFVLEELIKFGKDENVGNFAAKFTGKPPLEVRTPPVSAIFEAFSWLQASP